MQALTSDFELPASLHSELVASHPPSANPQLRAELMAHTHKSPQAGPFLQVTCLSLSQARKNKYKIFLVSGRQLFTALPALPQHGTPVRPIHLLAEPKTMHVCLWCASHACRGAYLML